MTDKHGALLEQRGHLWERQILRETNRALGPRFFELLRARFISFADNNKQCGRLHRLDEPVAELAPILQSPILPLASAARMKSQQRPGASFEKFLREYPIFLTRIEHRSGIFEK